MKRRIKIIQNIRQDKTIKVRRRYTIMFFAIVFPFLIFISAILYWLSMLGISPTQMFSPMAVVFVCSILCMILGYLVSYLLMNMIYKPMEQLSEASQQVARGNYDIQLPYNGHIEEINTMIGNFNFMVQELNSVEIMRKDFIANVSHEFKTPLSSITGYVTLLQDPDLSEEERTEYIQMAFFNINKLNDLTGNILQLSKLENQSTIEEPVTYRLDEQLREAIVLLEPKWNEKQLSLDLDLHRFSYTGQQALLFQVWTNLIGNAIKFSNPGGTIAVRMQQKDQMLEVIISDDGIGMDEETQAHIFEKFYQGDSSRKAHGNGLGLALCKKIVDLSNGHIFVSSEPGKGSVFMVQLPNIEHKTI